MVLEGLPDVAAWRHQGARDGSEVVLVDARTDGTTFEGSTVAVEAGEPWVVDYRLVVDDRWLTRSAEVSARARLGRRSVRLEHDGHGNWLVDGQAAPALDGCLDVDLEASALTNTLPVHRLLLAPDGHETASAVSAPAAFVRAPTVAVERLEQSYARLDDGPEGPRFDYAAPVFDVRCVLADDAAGLVLVYPGLAVRTAVEPRPSAGAGAGRA